MDKCNTACLVCRILLVAFVAALAAGIWFSSGCISLERQETRTRLAAVIEAAYNAGGCEAVSNRIEKLVADGKISRAQGDAIHAWAQVAYATVIDELDGGAETNACDNCSEVVTNDCDNCSVPTLIECGDGDCGDCNEDAYCGECEDCKAKE